MGRNDSILLPFRVGLEIGDFMYEFASVTWFGS